MNRVFFSPTTTKLNPSGSSHWACAQREKPSSHRTIRRRTRTLGRYHSIYGPIFLSHGVGITIASKDRPRCLMSEEAIVRRSVVYGAIHLRSEWLMEGAKMLSPVCHPFILVTLSPSKWRRYRRTGLRRRFSTVFFLPSNVNSYFRGSFTLPSPSPDQPGTQLPRPTTTILASSGGSPSTTSSRPPPLLPFCLLLPSGGRGN